MYHLSFVRLNRNQLSDKGLPKGVFNISTLLDLQLSHNQINSIPMISSHLEHLHLNHNHIERKFVQLLTQSISVHFGLLSSNKSLSLIIAFPKMLRISHVSPRLKCFNHKRTAVILSTQLNAGILKSRLPKWSLGKSMKASRVVCVPSHSKPLMWMLQLSLALLLMAKSVFFTN